MVLGTSDVRLIDMTRAFASVANKGVAVTPYGIRKVVTADGRLLYQHEATEERVLVAPWVAAEMTDLLQSAVLTGTGRAAQIGRPGRRQDRHHQLQQGRLVHRLFERADDRRVDGPRRCPAVAGLQGGTAPARAFHDFMSVAVANRPVEQFETQVPMPDWQLTPGRRDVRRHRRSMPTRMRRMVDENGNADRHHRRPSSHGAAAADGPARTAPASPRSRSSTRPSRRNRSRHRQPQPQPQPPPPPAGAAASAPPPDPPEPRPDAA